MKLIERAIGYRCWNVADGEWLTCSFCPWGIYWEYVFNEEQTYEEVGKFLPTHKEVREVISNPKFRKQIQDNYYDRQREVEEEGLYR